MASSFGDVLRRVDIFENVSEAELDRIAALLKERKYRQNQVIFKQGDVGDALYIVADGRIKVYTGEGAQEKVLAFFSEGGVLGEMALLTGEPRSAGAMAVTDARVLLLSKADFDEYLATNNAVMREMMRLIALRQQETNLRLTRGTDEAVEVHQRATGKVYTVFGPRGGSGKSTIAVNLAVSFAQLHPDQVCLFDLSLTFGHCALLLNLVPKVSVAGIGLDALSKMDREGMNYYLVPHASTLKLLAGSTKPEEGEAVTADHVKAAIELLRRMHAVTIIDAASSFAEATIAAIESSDKVVLVCTPEITTLRDVRECQRIFTDLIRLPRDKVFYVLNQTLPFKPLPSEQFSQALEQQMHCEVPYGADVPSKAAIRGEAFTQIQPGSNVSKAIEKMARMLDAEASPAKPQERRGFFARR